MTTETPQQDQSTQQPADPTAHSGQDGSAAPGELSAKVRKSNEQSEQSATFMRL